MKIKLSKAQWEMVGTKAGWMKKAQEDNNSEIDGFLGVIKTLLSLHQYNGAIGAIEGAISGDEKFNVPRIYEMIETIKKMKLEKEQKDLAYDKEVRKYRKNHPDEMPYGV